MSLFDRLYTAGVSRKLLSRAKKQADRALTHQLALTEDSTESLSAKFQALRSLPTTERVVPALALIREAASRALDTPHYPVQLLAGLTLLQRNVAEMRTGEGKTLTVTLPAAILALEGQGVHVVTANEYLAHRDAELMTPVYAALGLTVGVTLSSMTVQEKAEAYRCDITYGVGSEFGFDFLKDNLAREAEHRVQRPAFAAIVDEVDSILIDEARVPLIIAEPDQDFTGVVQALMSCVQSLSQGEHFEVDLKERTAELTEAGYSKVEDTLVHGGHFEKSQDLYAAANLLWVRRLHAAVKARALYRKNRDYVVVEDEIVLVDPGTGRSMPGRRLEDGLHEALEALEGLSIKRGTVVKASITYQSYFGRYPLLSGLTGTAATDAEEFAELYNLEVVVIPTNKPPARVDLEDQVYLTKEQKFLAAAQLAKERARAGQPVLIGCASIRDAEYVDSLLTRLGVEHETLTAKHISREASIIANAGRPGAVTVATNVAGRGTDILLGGAKPQRGAFSSSEDFDAELLAWQQRETVAVEAGGLFVVATERNGLRRVDNQLAGRSGRQGNPGAVQFLMSLEDELLKVFGRSRQLNFVRGLLKGSGSALGGAHIAKLVTSAQQAVESQGFGARKSLLKYDSVLGDQRSAAFALRARILNGEALDVARDASMQALQLWVASNISNGSLSESWDVKGLKAQLEGDFGLEVPLTRWVVVDELSEDEIAENLISAANARLAELELSEPDARDLALEVFDEAWTDHLTVLRELQDNANLKSRASTNPVAAFNKEAFELFKSFENGLAERFAAAVMPSLRIAMRQEMRLAQAQAREAAAHASKLVQDELTRRWVGRNDQCPCGSGKRFKDCHGALA